MMVVIVALEGAVVKLLALNYLGYDKDVEASGLLRTILVLLEVFCYARFI